MLEIRIKKYQILQIELYCSPICSFRGNNNIWNKPIECQTANGTLTLGSEEPIACCMELAPNLPLSFQPSIISNYQIWCGLGKDFYTFQHKSPCRHLLIIGYMS